MNLFIVEPGQRTCWHRHQHQTDEFRVIKGAIRFGLIEDGVTKYFRHTGPRWRFTVKPGLWHGYENISNEQAWLLMYLDKPYGRGEDEEIMTEASMPWAPAK